MDRAKWFNIHSWVGFKFALLLSFVLVTGTFATVSHEIDWLTNAAKRVSPSTVEQLDWVAVYASALEQVPDKALLNLGAPVDPWFSVELTYYEHHKQLHRQFFHPTTGEHLGDGRWYNWQRFFRMSHRHLMVPTAIGISIVGLLGVLMLLSLITALVVYKRWWAGFLRMPRTHHRKVFWGDLHRLFGVWSLWFVLVIAVTGVWYLAELWGLRATYPERAEATSVVAQEQAVMPTAEAFSAMVAQIREIYPELQIQRVFFPRKAGHAVIFQGQADAILVRPRVNAVSFDPFTAAHLKTIKGEEMSAHVRISEAADPLHFGTFGGLISKLVYFVFGVILSGLAISGTYIYGMRVARINKSEPSQQKRIWRAAIAHMTWGKWISYLSITVCAVLTVLLFGGLVAA